MNNIAIIPARGGSKRIPRKNIRDFRGRPVIAYSIEAAAESKLFDQIVVSTDDAEIAEVARRYGATTPFFRPSELADDHTGTNAVVRHALEWFSGQGHSVTFACCIYATAPLLQSEYLIEGYRRLVDSGKSYAFSVTDFEFPPQRGLRRHEDGSVESLYPEFVHTRSQDLETAWHDAGQFYWGRSEAFLRDVPLYSAAALGIAIPRHRVQDIDTLEDWRRAELMHQVLAFEAASQC